MQRPKLPQPPMFTGRADRQAGFTIIELMIATSVLSVILLLSTTVINGIGTLYFKGINQSHTQSDTRNIIDDVTAHLQLNSGTDVVKSINPDGTAGMYCIGPTRYTFQLGTRIGDRSGYYHVLWRDATPSGGCTSNIPDLTSSSLTDGAELIASGSRLYQFEISSTSVGPNLSSPYTVKVGVAYGDDDLLCNDNVHSGSCSSTATMSSASNAFATSGLRCKSLNGQQYCATAELDTTVSQRL